MEERDTTHKREQEEKTERIKQLKASSGVQHTYLITEDVKNKAEIHFDNHLDMEPLGIGYSNTDVMLFAPDQENIINTATYVLCMKNTTDSTKQWLAMAPAKNCTVKHGLGKAGTDEHIVELSMPEVVTGEPVEWRLTWALPNNEYERFMMGAGKWLVTYQY